MARATPPPGEVVQESVIQQPVAKVVAAFDRVHDVSLRPWIPISLRDG